MLEVDPSAITLIESIGDRPAALGNVACLPVFVSSEFNEAHQDCLLILSKTFRREVLPRC